jgi:DNA (cytosine-5)-methyltransferase 1
MGYAQAGFDVVGVDINKQSRYPFPFIRADVLDMDPRFLATFDVIHASPPCQFATLLKHAPGGKQHPNLIPGTRALLKAAGRPYIIENVEPAAPHLIEPCLLCGTMFGLGAEGCELRRHRYFETSFRLMSPRNCRHTDQPVIGVYGGHARKRSAKHGGRGTKDTWATGHRGAAETAMQMPWATLNGMSEAIPPAYTEFLGRAALALIASARVAA